MITPQQLKAITGKLDVDVVNALNETFHKYDISTPLRERHFLSQILHESENLTAVKENLNYSSNALLAVFKKYFPTRELADQFARKPEAIGNKVYANRNGNGNEASGDGYRYRGRGYIQVTGKVNYLALSKELQVDFVAHPELLEQPNYACLSAGWYWKSRNLNAVADSALSEAATIESITQKINGGQNGIDDRKAIYAKLKTIIN